MGDFLRALGLLFLLAPFVVAEDSGGEVAQQVEALLSAEAEPKASLASDLALLGPAALPSLFGAAAGNRVGSGANAVDLGPARRAAVLSAIDAQPSGPLLRFLAALDFELLTAQARQLGVRLVGARGDARHLALVIDLAAKGSSDVLATGLRRAVADAVEAIVARDPRGSWELQSLYDSADEALLSSLVRGLAQGTGDEGIQTLARLLGRAPAMDAFLLSTLARKSERVLPPTHDYARASVRAYLTRLEPELVRLAARTAGRLRDDAAIPDLIELLGSEDAAVAKEAHLALRTITGLGLRPKLSLWDAWYLDEINWWARRGPQLIQRFGSMDAAELASSILEVSSRRLSRPELAEAVLFGLERPEPDLVCLTAAALGKLGSRSGVSELIELLSSAHPGIRRAARAALAQILGRDLGAEPEAWRAAPELDHPAE